MPTVTPPPQTPSQTQSPSANQPPPTPVEATLGNTPDKIQDLAHAIQVTGTLTAPPDAGQITLTTALGDLNIVLPQLAADQQDKLIQQLTSVFQGGKPLTVAVQPGSPPTDAILLLPASTAKASATSVAQPTTPQGIPQTSQVAPPPLRLTQGAILDAVILPPGLPSSGETPSLVLPAGGAAGDLAAMLTEDLSETLALKASLASETESSAALDQVLNPAPNIAAATALAAQQEPSSPVGIPSSAGAALLPSAVTAPTPNILAPGNPQTAQTPPGIPIPAEQPPNPNQALPSASTIAATPLQESALSSLPLGSSPQLQDLLQPGSSVSLTVAGASPPGSPPPLATQPNQIVATVTESGPQGQVLLSAGTATLYVRQSVDAPVGSTLLLDVGQARQPILTTLPISDAGTSNGLSQMLSALNQIDPKLAQQVMQNAVPQPGPAMTGALLFFMNAFAGGDLRPWIGPSATDALIRAGKADLIAKLGQQLAGDGELVRDAVVGEWRSYPVPVHNDNQFQILHFYVHRDAGGQGRKGGSGSDGDKAKAAPGTVRFLIDVRLSKLGAMQLDGFVRPKQLDMMFRSEQALPPGLDRELRETYTRALGAVGYAGLLQFQVGRRNWLQLQKTNSAGSLVT